MRLADTLRDVHPVSPISVLVLASGRVCAARRVSERTHPGSGNAVLIEGEPGIDKTTLIRTALVARLPGPARSSGARAMNSAAARWRARHLPVNVGHRGEGS